MVRHVVASEAARSWPEYPTWGADRRAWPHLFTLSSPKPEAEGVKSVASWRRRWSSKQARARGRFTRPVRSTQITSDMMRIAALSGTIASTGDVLTQIKDGLRSTEQWDALQTRNVCMFRLLHGPIVDACWRWFDVRAPFAGSLRGAVLRACFDQAFLMPPSISAFFLSQGLLEGLTLDASIERVRHSFLPAAQIAVPFWLCGHTVTFWAFPPHLRMPWAQCVSLRRARRPTHYTRACTVSRPRVSLHPARRAVARRLQATLLSPSPELTRAARLLASRAVLLLLSLAQLAVGWNALISDQNQKSKRSLEVAAAGGCSSRERSEEGSAKALS